MNPENVIHRRRADDWKPEAIEVMKLTTRTMDELSQDGFGRIRHLADLALLSLETPEGHRDAEQLAAVLQTISMIANDMESCINSEAESVGCNYLDLSWRRRADARRAFRESKSEGGAA